MIYMYATLELYGRTNFPAPFFSVHYFDSLYKKRAHAHEDWTIGWSVKGPYNQPLAIWR
jgi:hypothetical protein